MVEDVDAATSTAAAVVEEDEDAASPMASAANSETTKIAAIEALSASVDGDEAVVGETGADSEAAANRSVALAEEELHRMRAEVETGKQIYLIEMRIFRYWLF